MSKTFPVVNEEDYADEALDKIQERDLSALTWMNGNNFPDSPIEDLFFHKLDESTVYKYENGSWVQVFSYSPGYYTENELRNLFQSKNATLDALSYEVQEYPQWSIFGFNSLITCEQNWFLSICANGTKEEFKRYSGCKNLAYKNEVGTADFSDGVIRETHLSDDILTEHQYITGDVVLSSRSSSTSEWLKLDGVSTIGSLGSTYSGSNYKPLYDALWNREDVILQNTSGSVVSKGNNSTSDWQSNKQIILNWNKPKRIIQSEEFDLFNNDNTIWNIDVYGNESVKGNVYTGFNYEVLNVECLSNGHRLCDLFVSNYKQRALIITDDSGHIRNTVQDKTTNYWDIPLYYKDIEEDYFSFQGNVYKNNTLTTLPIGYGHLKSNVCKFKGYYYVVRSDNTSTVHIYRSSELLDNYSLYMTIPFNHGVVSSSILASSGESLYFQSMGGWIEKTDYPYFDLISTGLYKINLEEKSINKIADYAVPSFVSDGEILIYPTIAPEGLIKKHIIMRNGEVIKEISGERVFSYAKDSKTWYSIQEGNIYKYDENFEEKLIASVNNKVVSFNVYDVEYAPDSLPGQSFFVKK